MPLILPGNVATATASTGYEIANSCMFQDSGSAEMSRAIASTGSNTTWTVSAWVKRVELGQSSPIFGTGDGNANNDARMVFFDADDKIECSYYNSGYTYEVTTNRLFRDCSAWYHICILFDTTESTASNRIKIYVNGTQETSFATSSYPDEDAAFNFGNTSFTHFVNDMGGRNIRGSHYIAELVYIDGTASAVTNFGEYDSDSPTIWKPIDVSGLSVGTNGVYLDFEDSGNLGNAVDGGTDFTEGGLAATDQATDTPTNNFCVMNPLDNFYQGSTFTEGNLQVVMDTSGVESYNTSTFAVSKGKWYCEVKYSAASSKTITGVASELPKAIGTVLANEEYTWGYEGENGNAKNDGNGVSYGDTYTTNDIISIALDLTNNKLYFAKNGTWQNSGDPESGATGTGAAHSVTAVASTRDGVYYFGSGKRHADSVTSQWNFGGCPAFTISSGNADADGYGNFEYAVPSGYFSLCSKNLAEYG